MTKRTIRPGSVVTGNYYRTDGTPGTALFYVLYTEELDSSNSSRSNIVGFKITSQTDYVDNYCVALPSDKLKFLDRNSFVMCNRFCTIDNVTQELGTIGGSYYKQVYKLFQRFVREVDRQQIDNM